MRPLQAFSFARVASSALGLVAALSVGASACTADRPTGIVAGMSTQMLIPRDLKVVRILVKSGGEVSFNRLYKVYDGSVTLPGTLTFAPADGEGRGQQITLTVLGYSSDPTIVDETEEGKVTLAPAEVNSPRILRRSVLGYDAGRVAYLPVALSYTCVGVQCTSSTQTCVSGQCVDHNVKTADLPTYVPGFFEGTSEGCFDANICMKTEVPARLADPSGLSLTSTAASFDRCTFTVPAGQDASGRELPEIPEGTELNVRVVFGHSNAGVVSTSPRSEILDLGPTGFTIPDPKKPGVFRLAAGLCDPSLPGVVAANLATEVHVAPAVIASNGALTKSPFCTSKLPSRSLCAKPTGAIGDTCTETQLQSSPSAMGFLIDRRDTMYGPLKSSAFAALMQFPLAGTLLRHTSIAAAFTPPKNAGDLCASPATSALFGTPSSFDTTGGNSAKFVFGFDWAPANASLVKFTDLQKSPALRLGPAAEFGSVAYAGGYESFMAQNPAGFDVALGNGGFYDAIRAQVAKDSAAAGALFLIGTREFLGTCAVRADASARAAVVPPPATTQAAALRTYVLALPDSNPEANGAAFLAEAQALAVAGGTGAAYNAASRVAADDVKEGIEAFTKASIDLATCTYEAAAAATDTTTIAYRNQVGTLVSVGPSPACTDANGWQRLASGRIGLCPTACTAYREVVRARGLVAALAGASLDEIPVVVRGSGCTATTP